eukprot:62638_1
MMAIIRILMAILTCIHSNYSFKDEAYFQNALVTNGTLSLPQNIRNLSCNVALTAETNLTNTIHFYYLNITQEDKDVFRAYFTITTCCQFGHNTIEQMYHPTWTKAYNTYNWTNVTANHKNHVYSEWCDYCNCSSAMTNTSNNITLRDIPFFDGYGCGSHSCNDDSLDTVLYLLSEKRGIITLHKTVDDTDQNLCKNDHKSLIELSDYKAGNYIIAVGGFVDDDVGNYQMNWECVRFSRPIQDDQITPERALLETDNHTLRCGLKLHNQSNSLQHLVSYYTLNLTQDNINFPVTITTCDTDPKADHQHNFANTLYLVQQREVSSNHWEYNILYSSNYSSLCDNMIASDITLASNDEYPNNEYIIMVQNYWINEVKQFYIAVDCADPPIKHETGWWVFGGFVTFVTVLLIIYCVTKIHFFKRQAEAFKDFLSHFGLSAYLDDLESKVFLLKEILHLNDEELEEIADICGLDAKHKVLFVDACNAYQNGVYPPKTTEDTDTVRSHDLFKTTSQVRFVAVPTMESVDDEDEQEGDGDEEDVKQEELQPQHSMVRVATDRIESHENRANLQVGFGADRIERVIAHVLSICEDFSGLDAYQVLAVRARDSESYEANIHYIFQSCPGCCPRRIRYWQVMTIPQFYRAICTATIAFVLQTFGITVTLVILISRHVHLDNLKQDLNNCMVEDHWNTKVVLFNKILAFFWCLYISFSIGSKLRNLNNIGLYKILNVLESDELDQIKCVDFFIMRCGQMINYYTSFMAVIGSFFMIYDTSGNGADDAPAGVDMILNAIALFFILEIDNEIVFVTDYEDLPKIWRRFDAEYKRLRDDTVKQQQSAHKNQCGRACCHGQGQRFADVFGGFVMILLYVVGVLAPFAVFFCW